MGMSPGPCRLVKMNREPQSEAARVVIAGGGVAGIETLLALADLAGDRAELTLIAPEPEFLYKPLLVEEPFGFGPALRYELEPLVAEKGARFVQGEVNSVKPEEHEVELGDGSTLDYDFLVVCAGGRFLPALEGATTFPSHDPLSLDRALDRAEKHDHRLVFVVPGGVTWSLPLYEIALMTRRRALGKEIDVKIAIVTPESGPVAIFGPTASTAVGDLLRARGIDVIPNSTVRELGETGIRLSPGDRMLGPAVAVALPLIEGPAIEGLPSDERGFIPIDEQARVKGTHDVYAAGDGTMFPIKQGGLATQQADAAAEDIAHRIGTGPPPEPFRPVLRGKLLTGDESINLRTDVAGGGGEGEASLDVLWWPPQKISGRYLAPFLYHGEVSKDPEPPGRSLDVEVALSPEWHEEPMAIDPLEPPNVG
jgi:sulfide:quinone oxidoreductase